MTNIEIIRFRAWLEIGGEPDRPEDGSQGTVFPITYASITASLNSIPDPTVGGIYTVGYFRTDRRKYPETGHPVERRNDHGEADQGG